MHKSILAAALLLSAAACAPTRDKVESVDVLEDITCATRGGCAYLNSPVKVVDQPVELPRRPYKFFPLAEQLNFIDARSRDWVAPRGTLTDGASIPPIFVSLVGSPTAPEYVNAGAVHDAYCGVGNEGGANYHNAEWQAVHRMFYDALIASGTPDQRAKIMFAAVWLGGPRWNTYERLDLIPAGAKRAGLRKAMTYVQTSNPSLRQLERKLRRIQQDLWNEYPDLYPTMVSGDEREEVYEEEYYEEYYSEGESSGGTANGSGL